MTIKVGLVAGTTAKLEKPAPAGEMYQSPVFKKAAAYCQRNYDRWFILSAKHGLLDPKFVIDPYEASLKSMSREERARWAEMVLGQIARLTRPDATFYFHTGQRYREFLVGQLPAVLPFEGLTIGQQLAWYETEGAVAGK